MKSAIRFFQLSVLCLSILACVKSDFDEPPSVPTDPDIKADQIISMKDVMDIRIDGDYVKIGLDKFIQAVVVADDEGGNFYKTIVVEDENSEYGISLLIDEVELFNVFPVGRRVFIHVKDLWISDYNGLPQIGYGPYVDNNRKRMASIPAAIFREIILPGVSGISVTPVEVSINQLNYLKLNTLIKINGIEFANQGETYADTVAQNTVNRTLSTCSNQEILLRSSGYADFAGTFVPSGKGSIVAIYSIFGNDNQLMIRDLDDVNMTEPRCGSTAGDEPRISIEQMKAVYKGATTSAPKSYIQGVVISDLKYKNIDTRNIVVQEGNHGIVVRFTAAHSFQLGQEVKIVATDVEISEYNGLLQLNSVPNVYATLVGTGILPTPKEVTLKYVVDNLNLLESTLVTVKDAEAKGATIYNGNVTVQDATGTMILRTGSTATFANSPIPTGKISITAIVSEYTPASTVTPQLSMRNTTDVTGGMTGGGGGETRMTVQALRALYQGVKTTAPEGYIQGVVISDVSSKNITAKNLVLQDGNSGIVIRLTADNTYALGKELKIVITGIELSEFNKLLQLNNVPTGNVTVLGESNLPTPKTVTIAQLKADFESLESTLVSVDEVTLSGGTTMGGTLKATDTTGQIDLYTRTDASFAGSAVPSGAKTVTAIVSEFTTGATPGYQLNLRNLNDVK